MARRAGEFRTQRQTTHHDADWSCGRVRRDTAISEPDPEPNDEETIQGSTGEDTLVGDANPDAIDGGKGDDSLEGNGGADSLKAALA